MQLDVPFSPQMKSMSCWNACVRENRERSLDPDDVLSKLAFALGPNDLADISLLTGVSFYGCCWMNC